MRGSKKKFPRVKKKFCARGRHTERKTENFGFGDLFEPQHPEVGSQFLHRSTRAVVPFNIPAENLKNSIANRVISGENYPENGTFTPPRSGPAGGYSGKRRPCEWR